MPRALITLTAIVVVLTTLVVATPVATTPVAGEANYALHWLSAYPQAVCLDGTPAAYLFQPSATGSTDWQFYFQGGGWCYTPNDCYERSKTLLGSSLNFSVAYANFGPQAGLIASDCSVNPTFCNFNRVYMIYCDGNSFTGNRDQPMVVNGKSLYWRGQAILDAALADLAVNNATSAAWLAATQVMVTGCSAGGLASILHGDYVLSKLPSKALTHTGIAAISGFFLNATNLDGVSVYSDQMKMAFTMANSTLPAACIAANAEEPWKCNMAQYAYPTVSNRLFLFNSMMDGWQLMCILTAAPVAYTSYQNGNCTALWPPQCLYSAVSMSDCSASQLASIDDYGQTFTNIVSVLDASAYNRPGNGGFLASCATHCEAQSSSCFAGLAAPSGVTMAQAVDTWWNSPATAAAQWTVDCDTVTCNPKCAEYC